MDYTDFVSDLPEPSRIVFGSAEENEETMNRLGVSQIVRQIGKGPFKSDLVAHNSGQTDFFADRFNKAVSIELALPVDQVGFLFPRSANGDFRVLGRDLGTDKLVVLGGGQGVDMFIPALAGSEAVGISAEKYEALLETLFPEQAVVRSGFPDTIDGDTRQLQRLRSATLEAASGGSIVSDEESVENLLSGLVTWIIDSGGLPKREPSHTRAARYRVAKLAQDGGFQGSCRLKVKITPPCLS